MRWDGFSNGQNRLARRLVTPQLMGGAVRQLRRQLVSLVAIAAVTCLVPVTLRSQQNDYPGGFRYDLFNANEAVAHWLVQYDRVAWETTELIIQMPDSIIAALGPDWFCYEDAGLWHAFYGTYESGVDRYSTTLHFIENDSGFASAGGDLPDRFLPLARALSRSRQHFPPSLREVRVRFNGYVRSRDDGIEVWYLPAQQSDGTLVHGMAVHVSYSVDGRTLRDTTVHGSELRAYFYDTTATVDLIEEHATVPSVGSIFFILNYRSYFERVQVWTKEFLSNLEELPELGFTWLHARRSER